LGQEHAESQPNRALSLLATCGIIAPISFTVTVIILSSMWLGYNHVTDTLSKLGRVGAPNAITMNIAGFALRGILIFAFAFGLHRGISEGRDFKIGLVLMTIYGAADVLAALFPSDSSNLASFTNRMHDLFSFIAWIAMIFA